MLIVTHLPVRTPLSPFEKRDCTGVKGVNDSQGESPVAILGLVVAALTLLVGIVSLRNSRFRRWVSYVLTSYFVKGVLGITPPNPSPTAITTTEGLHAIPPTGISMPSPVLIYNDFSNTRPACRHSNAFPSGHIGIIGGGRAPQAEESLGPRRPKPVAPRHFR
ncbi:hypothetical protein HOY82DRAFT_599439 [Tuber indicum]|nr:hypothetical protein HOY82DRAFT_599439 [Tuber indicum]